ncbi:MAG: short-chain dehydrogenase/reductase [Caulobacter sp.]|nr:short-chain dehydrogenase/reductase [Caulobacter sp.]
MKLDSTVSAIVTGGASGLGKATVEALRAEGVKVAIFDMNPEAGEAVAAELGAVFCLVDITSDEQVLAGLEKARAANGQERVVINCAGRGKGGKTASRDKTTGEIKSFPMEDFERVVQINLIGTFRMISKCAAGMMSLEPLADGERGAIVNTASVAAEEGQVGQVAYSSSKAGIVGMTLNVARDLMGEGIRINTILPGIMDTPPMRGVPPQVLAGLSASVPFPKRLGHAGEFAALALHMVTNSYFNGEDVRLDGAIRMPAR